MLCRVVRAGEVERLDDERDVESDCVCVLRSFKLLGTG